jgi:hypothetical protein
MAHVNILLIVNTMTKSTIHHNDYRRNPLGRGVWPY